MKRLVAVSIIFACIAATPATTLDALTRAALAHAPAVRIARATLQVQLATADGRSASGIPVPFFSYSSAPQSGPMGSIAQVTRTVGATVSLSDLLARGTVLAARDAQIAQATQTLALALRDERLRIIAMYNDALGAQAIYRLRHDLVAAWQRDAKAAAVRVRSGDAPELDVVRADVALSGAQADEAVAYAVMQNANDALQAETSVPLQTLESLAVPPLPTMPVVATHPCDAQVLAAQASLRAAQDEVSVVRAQFGLAIDASVGASRGFDGGAPVSGPNVNLTLAVPVSLATSSRLRAASAAEDLAAAQLANVVSDAALRLRAAEQTEHSAERAYRASQRAVVLAERELHAVQIGYAHGASSSLEIVDARKTVAQTRIDFIARTYALAGARQVVALLGGSECTAL
ncbi:MAG: TolC family protein [Vulcanimicrobiaceae bacterium]